MIIEFLGVSGVGKTTVAKKYRNKLQAEEKQVIWDTYDLYATHGWLARNLKKALRVILFGITNPRWVKEYKCFLEGEIDERRDVKKLFFNGIYLKALLEKAQKDKHIHLFDEGSLQYLWAIKLRSKKSLREQDIKTIEKFYGVPDKVVIVDADAEVIAKRILNRGEYVRIMDNGDLLGTIQEMQGKLKIIANYIQDNTTVELITNN